MTLDHGRRSRYGARHTDRRTIVNPVDASARGSDDGLQRTETSMTNQHPPAPVPLGDDDDLTTPDVEKEVDGERVIDPDANDDLIDSAEADRRAAQDGGSHAGP